MTIKSFWGRQGCGMGPCVITGQYWKNRQEVLEHLDQFEDRCKECIQKNEEERVKES